MKYFLFLLMLFFLFPYASRAKKKEKNNQIIQDSVEANIEQIVYIEDENSGIYDSLEIAENLLSNWYFEHPYLDLEYFDNSISLDSNDVDFPDSVYLERISRIPSIIPLSYNIIVKNFIHVYTKERRDKVEKIIGLTDYYFPMFEEVLDYYDLPLELKYMPIIESALDPNAISRVGATGLWQFMYHTGKAYKLEINSLVDERRDPIASTHAAVKYLNDLYAMYNDWILAIAAYNCGPGNVNKAIRRTGGQRNYWSIYYYLPRETRGYVPAFIAALYVFNYYQEHNLKPRKFEYNYATDTIHIHKELHLQQVSEVLDIPLPALRLMNPQYRRDIIPSGKTSYTLKLPIDKTGKFIEMQDSIFAYKDSVFFNPDSKTSIPVHYSSFSPVTPKGYQKIYYVVKPGDNLGYIADWYDVGVSQLRYWNNIRRNLIRSGQKLIVFVPESRADIYQKINLMSSADKQKLNGKKTYDIISTIEFTETSNQLSQNTGNFEYYKVKRGDTLWEIARKYPGVTEYDIMKINNISNANRIEVGQELKILLKN
ncbi:transglycosylase SLT domain-containing protein [Bacteroidota bacterium]